MIKIRVFFRDRQTIKKKSFVSILEVVTTRSVNSVKVLALMCVICEKGRTLKMYEDVVEESK